ncbi:MAG TPA: hypothetical protein VFL16_09805 [Steroidobacteraceae bacterium]|nr:hypothetical protein [Steroidobacteraceae bacterium]
MVRVLLHCLLKLALAGVLLSPVARAEEPRALPQHLRDTGLYVAGVINPDVLPFSPQYPLWSDGAAKRRWIWLPPGTSIDASQPDAWDFPRGTKLWKEFAHGGRVIETRFIERGQDGSWRFASYVWNADGSDAVLAPASGLRDVAAAQAPGGRYSYPSQDDCRACHEGAPVPVLGFSALQLSPDRDPLAPHAERAAGAVDLKSLSERGLLRNLAPELLARPPRIVASTPAERAALGYLHGNCGNCHNDEGPLAVLEMTLAQRVAAPSAGNAVLRSIVGVESQYRPDGAPADAARIAPGHLAASVIAVRMNSRDPLQQMPPLGTRAVDADAVALMARWIESLD